MYLWREMYSHVHLLLHHLFQKLQMLIVATNSKDAYSLEESYHKPRQLIKKQICHLPTKVHIVKALVFPVVIYGYESWTIKKSECRRTDTLDLWCCRRLFRVPWTARRSNQSILKEINSEYSLEVPMLKFQYFDHLI